MSLDNNNSRRNLEEQRRRRAKSFQLNIQDNYDDDSLSSYNSESAELNSYSGQDVKEQIARESKNALKKKKRVEKKERKAKNKRNRRVFRWIWAISVVIVGVMLSAFIITGMNDLLAIKRTDAKEVTVEITSTNVDDVAEALQKQGVINEPLYFKLYATLTKSTDAFAEGTYKLRTDMDYQAILTNLESVEGREVVTITFIEGQNVLEIANKLKEEGALNDTDKFLELCKSDNFDGDYDFLKAIDNADKRYYKLEGYLWPDRYDFYKNEDPESIIYKFLNNYEAKITEKQDFSGYEDLSTVKKMVEESGTDYTLDEIMIIASIIQAEAANTKDMYYVSSIIHNRLEADVNLGVSNLGLDSTKFYPYRSEDDVPEDLGDDYTSNYDTYDKAGLPAGPICNPGMDAIKAAICPNDTDYYFFCHDADGTAYYASTIYEHNANLEMIQ